MNPLTNMKNVIKLSDQELKNGSGKASWHDMYRGSAWIFVGGMPYNLTEGDIICVFSQYGEISTMNLVRDKETGKSKGFCFICYEDQRSTILAVDNLNGIKILNRALRVDHVSDYKPPKNDDGAMHNYLDEDGKPRPQEEQQRHQDRRKNDKHKKVKREYDDKRDFVKREYVKREQRDIKVDSDSQSDDSSSRRRKRR